MLGGKSESALMYPIKVGGLALQRISVITI